MTGLELGGSEVIWSLSNTNRYSALPKPGLGVQPGFTAPLPSPERRTLAHPGAVQRLTNTNFLIADTGNNRVVEVDRAGTVLWELTDFADPLNLLGGAEPLTLSAPTDVQRWSVFTPTTTEVHTLVVDSGNHRILQIRDVYPRNQLGRNQAAYHVLVWASQTTTGDRFYDYRAAQRIRGEQLGLPAGEYTIATVSNWRVNSAEINGIKPVPDTDGSSIVVLDGPLRDANGNPVIENGRVRYPGGKVAAYANEITFSNGQKRFIGNPTSFQRYYTGFGTQQVRALFTDGNGFYDVRATMDPATRRIELQVDDAAGGAVLGRVENGLPANVRFDPRASGVVSAKRLPNGNTLLVNQPTGQIFEFEKTTRTLLTVTPQTSSTHSLSQPTSADRTF